MINSSVIWQVINEIHTIDQRIGTSYFNFSSVTLIGRLKVINKIAVSFRFGFAGLPIKQITSVVTAQYRHSRQ